MNSPLLCLSNIQTHTRDTAMVIANNSDNREDSNEIVFKIQLLERHQSMHTQTNTHTYMQCANTPTSVKMHFGGFLLGIENFMLISSFGL